MSEAWLLSGKAVTLALKIKKCTKSYNDNNETLRLQYMKFYEEMFEEHKADRELMWTKLVELVGVDLDPEQVGLNFTYHKAHGHIYLDRLSEEQQSQRAQVEKIMAGDTEH